MNGHHVVFKIWGWILFFLGIALILLGFIGILLPLVPGWLFIIAGAALLGETRVHEWLRTKWKR